MSHAIDRGVKVVYLDPRFTKTAAKATEWLPIRPGTDLAFHLALLQRHHRRGPVQPVPSSRNIRSASTEVASSVGPIYARMGGGHHGHPGRYDPAHRARICSAAGADALAHNGWRTSNFVNSFQTERAITILNALVGNWGTTLFPAGSESGGLGAPPQPAYPRVSALRLDGVAWKYPFVPLKFGVFQQMRDSIVAEDPYAAHGWFISRQNPAMSLPDRKKTLEAFGKMDFIVTVDILMNDTAWFSDVVLPEASYLERYDPLSVVGNRAFIRQPVIEPQGEGKSALWIYKQLGQRLGIGDFFQYKDEEDYLAQQLAPLGVSLADVRSRGYADLPESTVLNSTSGIRPAGRSNLRSDTLDKGGLCRRSRRGRNRPRRSPDSSIC